MVDIKALVELRGPLPEAQNGRIPVDTIRNCSCTLSSQTGSKNTYKSVDSVNTVNQKIQKFFLKIERDRGI